MSYSNFYNSYRYGNNNNDRNSGDNFAGNRQPVQPPHGYVEATYSWNNQGASSGLDNQQAQNSKVYSSNKDVYSRSQDTSSSFAHLPAALGSYSQAVRADENTQRPTRGLNSLAYASSLTSAYPENPGMSQPTKASAQNLRDSAQYQNTATGYNYTSQSSATNQTAHSHSTVNYNQQPQRSSSAASQTAAPSYAHSNSSTPHDPARHYQTQPAHMAQPERRPSPKANPQANAPRRVSQYKSPPTTHSSTNTSLNAPVYPQASQGYGSFTANTSAVSYQDPAAPRDATGASVPRTHTPPTISQNYTNTVTDNNANTTHSDMETRASEQISPSKVQFINPTDLYTQQYFLAQERARAAEAEAAAEENRRKEAEAQMQSQAEAVARAAEAATTADTLATPTGTDKRKSTKTKPAKNSSKKRSSLKGKAAERDPTTVDVLETEDDMASEMRLMLEKLRGMRTKDPSLFSRLWEDFKKAPPSNQAASSTQAASSEPVATTTTPPLTGQGATDEAPGSESLPDLGEFPAMRRKRNRKSDLSKLPSNPQSDIPATTAQVNVDSMLNQQAPSQPPPTAFETLHATSTTTSNSVAVQSKETKASTTITKPQTKANTGQDATWPAAVQQKLAKAASEYLGKDPANQGKQGSPEAIMLLLQNNPSYPDLCSQLESRGFALDRQAMARFLLSSVPTLVNNNNEQKTETAKNAPAPALQVAQPLPLATTQPMLPQPNGSPSLNAPISDPQHGASVSKPQAPAMTRLDLYTGAATFVSLPEQQKRKETNKSSSRPRKSGGQFAAVPVIGPKAEMSRKRLFSEIVDMSQVSSDEEDEDPYAGPRESSHFDLTTVGQPGLVQDAVGVDTDSPHATEHELSGSRTARQADMAQPDIEFDPDDEFVLESIKKLPNLARPIKPSAALSRVYYNPKYIARDILLATGRHPSERPLNYHLMRFMQIFPGVSPRSDFETFRWDLVDPGGPSMPVVELEDILVEQPQITRKRRRRRDASRDAGDGHGPTSSDSQAAPNAKPSFPSSTSLSTPQQAVRNSMAGTPTSGQRTGRRGRPPGAKNKNPTKAALKAAAAATTASSRKPVRIAGPDPTPNVPEPSYPVFTCQWASCPAQLHDFHTLERHVNKVHLPGQKTCQWQSCPNSTTEYSDEALKDHLEKAHTQPLAWKYGDGPSVNGTDFELDRYLNANGLIVTPDTATAGDTDTLIFPVEQRQIRAFNKLYGDQKPTERAQQVLRAIRKRRKHVGIGLEQEGCEFSNPVRNKLFVNDEEWYEVVDDEEGGVDTWFSQGDDS